MSNTTQGSNPQPITAATPAQPAAAVQPQATIGTPAPHRYSTAYEKTLPATEAIAPDELITINVDVAGAVTLALGTLKKVMPFRDRAAALPEFDVAAFDELEQHALAMGHAHTLYLGVSAAPEAILELNEEGMKLRGILYADASALATRKLISGDRIGEMKANVGYQNLAFDLMALAQVLRGSWDKIASKTAVTTDDLDRAELIGDQLVNALSDRAVSPQSAGEVALQRQRNFTLLARTYDQVRRAITFLRWDEGDMDQLAPSLYSGRGNSNAKKKEDPKPNGGDVVTQPAAGASRGVSAPLGGGQAPGPLQPVAPSTGLAHAEKGPFVQ